MRLKILEEISGESPVEIDGWSHPDLEDSKSVWKFISAWTFNDFVLYALKAPSHQRSGIYVYVGLIEEGIGGRRIMPTFDDMNHFWGNTLYVNDGEETGSLIYRSYVDIHRRERLWRQTLNARVRSDR